MDGFTRALPLFSCCRAARVCRKASSVSVRALLFIALSVTLLFLHNCVQNKPQPIASQVSAYTSHAPVANARVAMTTDKVPTDKADNIQQNKFKVPGCDCYRVYIPDQAFTAGDSSSNCGLTADMRGRGQNVVSYSFYGNAGAGSSYFAGIERNIVSVRAAYPDWIVRVYHNMPHYSTAMCQLLCRYDNLDFCDVHNLPGLGDLSNKFGMIWRFMPLGDHSVNRFLVRDLDSIILPREKAAVEEWIESGKSFHSMRDHPFHRVEFMGGMWGGWNRFLRPFRNIRRRIIQHAYWKFKGLDQTILSRVLWPMVFSTQDLYSHDSYLCTNFPMTHPFPTRRRGAAFVGAPAQLNETTQDNTTQQQQQRKPYRCPLQCRPPSHQDWIYC